MSSSAIDNDHPVHELPTLAVLSIWFGVLLIGLTAAAQLFVEHNTGTNPLVAALHFILIAFILASFVYLMLGTGQHVKVAAIPLLINVGTLIIVRFVPFVDLWESFRFQWHRQAYNEVVALVESGKVAVSDQGLGQLPPEYRHLSADGGQIMVSNAGGVTAIFFFSTRHN